HRVFRNQSLRRAGRCVESHARRALAKASGGRAYLRDPAVEMAAIYDDIMEHFRVRDVITYVSSNPATTAAREASRVTLVEPRTGGPLAIVDATGKVTTARVIVQGSYTP